jgi:SEC-C motif
MSESHHTEGRGFWAERTQELAIQAEDAVRRIEKLAQSVNASRLFAAVIANMAIAPAELINETTHGSLPAKLELLAYYLYPFFGASDNPIVSPWHTNACIQALEQLHIFQNILGLSSRDVSGDPVARIHGHLQRQARIVRGSAYQEQTAEEIVSIQGRFEGWFAKRMGIGPNRTQAILWSVFEKQQQAVTRIMPEVRKHALSMAERWERVNRSGAGAQSECERLITDVLENKDSAGQFGWVESLNRIAPDELPVSKDSLAHTTAPTDEEWESLIKLIGLTELDRSRMNDPLQVRQRPLFVLPGMRVLLVDMANTMDVVWDRFEEIAKRDQRFFDGSYQKKKSRWLEEKVAQLLGRLFPPKHLYRNLAYPDPNKTDVSAVAELDIAVQWGPFLILVEAKAKQFRMESQLGDVGRLRTDIERNVEDAFQQAKRAVKYITRTAVPKFMESTGARHLIIDKQKIRRIYLLTISQHHLAGLATRLASVRDLGLFTEGEYPLSISVADLETVTEFCEGPDMFLHYVERRLQVQKDDSNLLADELDFFGAYLDTRLQPSRFGIGDGRESKAIWLSGFSEMFDSWFMYKRGQIQNDPQIKLQIPQEIDDLLAELRKRNDDGSRWVAFALLELSDKNLSALAQGLRDIRRAKLTPGMFRRISYQDRDTVISIVASLDQPPDLLYRRTDLRAAVEKYRRKAVKSIAFGIIAADKSKPFECVSWHEGPWKFDERLESLLRDEPDTLPAPGQRLPGRNEPCLCGSGRKFKKCCEEKIKASRKRMLNGV